MFSIFITIVLILAIIGSIAAWINTKIIIDELEIIKKHIGIKEEKKKSILDDDLDN